MAYPNFGALMKGGHLSSPAPLYCPLQEEVNNVAFKASVQLPKWDDLAAEPTIRSSYTFSPRVDITPPMPGNWPRQYVKMTDYLKTDILGIDVPLRVNAMSHLAEKGFTVLMSDGSASLRSNEAAFNFFATTHGGGYGGNFGSIENFFELLIN